MVVVDGQIQPTEEIKAMVPMFMDTMMMQHVVELEAINDATALEEGEDFGLVWELEDSWDTCSGIEEGKSCIIFINFPFYRDISPAHNSS